MFCLNPNYNEMAIVRYEYVPKWEVKKVAFLSTCWKMCPHCGAILKINAHGCDNCFFQFDKSCQGLRRSDE